MIEQVNLTNETTGESILLDKSFSPYAVSLIDWGVVQSTHHTYKYVNQTGMFVMGTTLETRDVVLEGWVIAENEDDMNYRKRFLNRFVSPRQLMRIDYKGYYLTFIPSTSVHYATSENENNDRFAKFEISGVAFDPIFKSSEGKRIFAANTVPLFHFPLIIKDVEDEEPHGIVFGVRKPSVAFDVNNYGDIEVGMKITLTAKGTLENPKVTNVDTLEYFKINKTLSAGEQVVINTSIGEKSVYGFNGGVKSNYFTYKDTGSTWLQLALGKNTFVYSADSGIDNLEVEINFNYNYLEVQECY